MIILSGQPTLKTLANFTAQTVPVANLVSDAAGDLFVPAVPAGSNNETVTLLEIPAGTSSIVALATYDEGPVGDLTLDAAGDLFGTPFYGGPSGDGAVVELAKGSSSITTLASFNGGNGEFPLGYLVEDTAGDLFGTTNTGGGGGAGTVFELAAGAKSITTLASFNGVINGNPGGGLVEDAAGDLFGTTFTFDWSSGGPGGTVFELAAGASSVITVASFNGRFADNSGFPNGGLIGDAAGDLFGTTVDGGWGNDGTVFEIVRTPAGYSPTPLVLLTCDGPTGTTPCVGLIADAAGDLFGTTLYGGAGGQGTAFEIPKTANGYASTPIILAAFTAGNGSGGLSPLTADAAGNLYGVTFSGGSYNHGTAFEITHSGFVPFVDNGPTVIAGSVTIGHGQTIDVTSFIAGLISPGSPLDTETITAVTGNATLAANGDVFSGGAGGFTYTVEDQNGKSAIGTVAVTVDPGPAVATGFATVPAGFARDLTPLIQGLITPGLAGDIETISAVTGSAILSADGAVTYIAPSDIGRDSFAYTVTDGYGDSATGTVDVMVTPVTTVAANATVQAAAGTAYHGGGNDTFYVTAATIADSINGGGNSFLGVKDGGTSIMGSNISGFSQVHLMGGTAGAAGFSFTANATRNLIIVGSKGNDVITAGDASQTIDTLGQSSVVQATAATAGVRVQAITGTATLDISGGGSATLNSDNKHGLFVRIDQAMLLNLGGTAFITATAVTAGTTLTAGAAYQTLISLAGGATFIGATATNTWLDTFKGTASGLNADVIENFGKTDVIDITDVQPGGISYSGDQAREILGFNGSTLILQGNYNGSLLRFSSDGAAGTLVSYLG